MNVGSGKYHSSGPSCTCRGKKVPCLVEFSERGGISGHIITKVLRQLDDLKLYDNDRKNGIIPALLVDGHVSSFDLFKIYIYVMKITNGLLFLVFCMEHHCDR